jgi:hypothetical protein
MERFASTNDTSNCFLFLPLQPNADAEAFNAVSVWRMAVYGAPGRALPLESAEAEASVLFFGHGDFSGMDREAAGEEHILGEPK